MNAAAPIAAINPPPRRFNGVIHDTVVLRDEERERLGAVTIIGGHDPDDTVSVSLHHGRIGGNVMMSPQEAIRVGQILVAAGNDALASRRTCDRADCPNPPAGGGAFCGEHQGESDL